MPANENHWGRWILERSRFVGFSRQSDFALAVGCSRARVVKWGSLKNPPQEMRKGLDWKLAWALKTSHEMLFKDWINTPSDKAREFIFKRPEGRPPPDPNYFAKATDRQLLEEFFDGCLFPNLSDQQVEELAGSALAMLATKMDAMLLGELVRGFEHPFLDRMKAVFERASQPPRPGEGGDDRERKERPMTAAEFKKKYPRKG